MIINKKKKVPYGICSKDFKCFRKNLLYLFDAITNFQIEFSAKSSRGELSEQLWTYISLMKTNQKTDGIEFLRIDLGSAWPFAHKLLHRKSFYSNIFLLIFVSLSFFADLTLNWISIFVLFAIHINEPRNGGRLTQNSISLLMVFVSTIFLYYKLTQGYAIIIKEARSKGFFSK